MNDSRTPQNPRTTPSLQVLLLLTLLAGMGSGCPPSPSPHYWTKYRSTFVNNGIGNDGVTDGFLAWKTNVGARFSTPCIGSNNLIYVGGVDPDTGQNGLFALDPKHKGARKWFGPTAGTIRSSPGYSVGKVFVGCDDGKLYAWDADTGTPLSTPSLTGQIWSSPTFFSIQRGGKVFDVVCVGDILGVIRAFDANSAAQLWENTSSAHQNALRVSPAVGPVSPGTGSGQLVYFATDHGDVFALNCETGGQIWNKNYQSEARTSPIFNGTLVYVSCANTSSGSTFYGLNSETGDVVWAFPHPDADFFSSAALAAGGSRLYVGDDKGRLFALSPSPVSSQGESLWNPPAGGPQRLSELAVDSGRVYAGAGPAVVTIDRNTRQIQNLISTGGVVLNSGPIIGPDGAIYCAALDGFLYAIKQVIASSGGH